MIKRDSLEKTMEKIISVINDPLIENGFTLKKKFFFERKNKASNNIEQYEFNLKNPKGYFSLHLILNLLNDSIMTEFNDVLKQSLLDPECVYPPNWGKKNIEESVKSATSSKKLLSLTDWKELKEHGESLAQFNSRFSIWLCVFDKIEEITNWKEQLLLSVELAKKWYSKVNNNETIIKSTDLKAMFLLKKQGEIKKLEKIYNEIISENKKNNIDSLKVKLFYKHLIKLNN